MNNKIYSFEIFDICLARLCGDPRLLFDVLSLKVMKMMGENCSEHLRELFVAARLESSGRNLAEIYENVANRFPFPFSIKEMIQLELDTEREMLVPIMATKSLVDKLRQKGRILYISDIYLPSYFIREQLVRYGFYKKGDIIYVSEEKQAWKYDGSLFRLVHDREIIPYRQWHHFGANRHSDYLVPRRLGIHAHQLHFGYLHYESIWRERTTCQYQYPSILSGICRAMRLSKGTIDWQNGFVCDISAPLMISWVLRVLKDANRRGIKRLFFCARDVHSEYLIAQKFSVLFPEIEIKYLLISSNALYNCENRLDYFRSVGLVSNIPTAIVDSCTSGKTLCFLNGLFRDNEIRPVRGYFFLKMRVSQDNSFSPGTESLATYEFLSSYLRDIGNKRTGCIPGMRIFYELLFSLNYHLKTVGYEYSGDNIRPVFARDVDDYWSFVGTDIRLLKKNNDNLLLGVADAMLSTGLIAFCDEIFENIAQQTLVDFISYPHKDYLNYLSHFYWQGKPYVNKIIRRDKGVWKRGCLFFSLPIFLIELFGSISYRPKLNNRLNRIMSDK